ncbi:MAG TPA: LuxR C-terminal-related transcriptional regulator [Candidatus Acidoferrales bacterium]|nr:LuxR C-terminal-related transcriptional regulator [Candidatus Acidoferrales bacterium]
MQTVEMPEVKPLSVRQAEIAALVVQGRSNREIAETLSLSERTVETHVANLFNKLSIQSRRQVAAALRALEIPADARLNTNLPHQAKKLVGRSLEIAEISRALRSDRLVTILGTGGVGKTRTALQLGAELREEIEGGVWLVELAGIREPSRIWGAIAHAMRVRESPNHPLFDQVVAAIEGKPVLLILDNCEHLIDGVAKAVTALLGACAAVSILATSREPLRIGGERTYRLPSLSIPPRAALATLRAGEATTYSAITLFVERACATNHRFGLTDENAPAVAEICTRLDGIPLALELAAARLNVLSVHGLLARLDQRFEILSNGPRSVLPRHTTMRAVIDWSYDLLGERERRLFEMLAVFAGGCTLEALAALCDEGPNELDILQTLSSLVDKSLVVVVDTARGDVRYNLLESSRHYAREKLAARDEWERLASRHAAVYLDLAERLRRVWLAEQGSLWRALAEAELENWRAALEFALRARGCVTVGQRLVGELYPLWVNLAYKEGVEWLRVALDMVDENTPPAVAGELEYVQAQLALTNLQDVQTGLDAARRSAAWYQQAGDVERATRAQVRVGYSLVRLGATDEGEQLLREILARVRHLGNAQLLGAVLYDLALVRTIAADITSVRTYLAEALDLFESTGNTVGISDAMNNLAEAEYHAGDVEAALQHARRGLTVARAADYNCGTMTHNANIAAYCVALNRFDEAIVYAREALELARDAQSERLLTYALQHHAAIAALQPLDDDDLEIAARIIGFVDASLPFQNGRDPTEEEEAKRIHDALAAALPAQRRTHLLIAGAAMTQEQAIREASLASDRRRPVR